MAKIMIEGHEYDIVPYKLGSLRKAAPHIDRINAAGGAMASIEAFLDVMDSFIAVLSVGLVRIDPTLTPDKLEDMLGFEDRDAIMTAFKAILEESGLKPGEARAPLSDQAAGASTPISDVSSTS